MRRRIVAQALKATEHDRSTGRRPAIERSRRERSLRADGDSVGGPAGQGISPLPRPHVAGGASIAGVPVGRPDPRRHGARARAYRGADRFGLAHQNQKRRLKRVVGLVRVAHQAAAKSEDHRAVPFDQNAKRLVANRVMAGLKTLEQLAIVRPPRAPASNSDSSDRQPGFVRLVTIDETHQIGGSPPCCLPIDDTVRAGGDSSQKC